MLTIPEIDEIAKRATERIAKDFAESGFANPPVVTHGIARAVLEAAEQSVRLTRFPQCKGCEYNPCDLANNSDYCPARR